MDAAGDLHAAAKPQTLRWSLSSHFESEATIDQPRALRPMGHPPSQNRCRRFGLVCRYARFLVRPTWLRGGLNGLGQPHGRVPSVSCLRNDSCTAALSETITLAAQKASARAARLRPAYTHRITHRRGKGQRTGAVVTRPAAHTQRTYDTARGSHHDDRPPLARLPLDL